MTRKPQRKVLLEISRKEHKVSTSALLAGAAKLGYEVRLLSDVGLVEAGKMIAGGGITVVLRRGNHHPDAAIADLAKACGVPILAHDLGFLARAAQDGFEGHYQLCPHQICTLPLSAPDGGARWRALRIPLEPMAWPDPRAPRRVLVLGQVPMDSQHHLSNRQLCAWIAASLQLRGITHLQEGAAVYFRPHPYAGPLGRKPPTLPWIELDWRRQTLQSSMAEADLIACYNSTGGLDALLSGKPVLCHPGAHFARVANASLRREDIREEYLHRLAWAQWTLEEMADGTALKHVLTLLGKR